LFLSPEFSCVFELVSTELADFFYRGFQYVFPAFSLWVFSVSLFTPLLFSPSHLRLDEVNIPVDGANFRLHGQDF